MIAIIGRGNVATHLWKALKDKEDVCMVNPRTLENMPPNADMILLCVSDNVIEEVSSKLPATDSIIAHTSGSVPMSVLQNKHKVVGVFYPLQTFTKSASLDYSEIPVFIEGSSEKVVDHLKKVASLFSNDVREADSQSRQKLHLASVFACNFVNALAYVSQDILNDSSIDFSVLTPLMKQTVDKLQKLSPKDAQTGPAVRGDANVIAKHLEMLSNKPDYQELYQQLTKIIRNE